MYLISNIYIVFLSAKFYTLHFFQIVKHARVPLERDNSEAFLKREARASQLADEIEASASYKARAALENDERSEEEKYSSVARDTHSLNR